MCPQSTRSRSRIRIGTRPDTPCTTHTTRHRMATLRSAVSGARFRQRRSPREYPEQSHGSRKAHCRSVLVESFAATRLGIVARGARCTDIRSHRAPRRCSRKPTRTKHRHRLNVPHCLRWRSDYAVDSQHDIRAQTHRAQLDIGRSADWLNIVPWPFDRILLPSRHLLPHIAIRVTCHSQFRQTHRVTRPRPRFIGEERFAKQPPQPFLGRGFPLSINTSR